jgi:Domain of unknown function (DUF1902)
MAETRRCPVEVHAIWDAEAGVWSAEADNLPGLVTEAEDPQLLMQKLGVMVPELLSYSPDLADVLGPEIHLVLERTFEAQTA